jgi:hypothetical protein
MTDTKTRKKIIEIYGEDYSKRSIKEQTGVSLPSIRKILREDRQERGVTSASAHDYRVGRCEFSLRI